MDPEDLERAKVQMKELKAVVGRILRHRDGMDRSMVEKLEELNAKLDELEGKLR